VKNSGSSSSATTKVGRLGPRGRVFDFNPILKGLVHGRNVHVDDAAAVLPSTAIISFAMGVLLIYALFMMPQSSGLPKSLRHSHTTTMVLLFLRIPQAAIIALLI